MAFAGLYMKYPILEPIEETHQFLVVNPVSGMHNHIGPILCVQARSDSVGVSSTASDRSMVSNGLTRTASMSNLVIPYLRVDRVM